MMISMLTTASKNVSNFEPSTVLIGLALLSFSILTASIPFVVSGVIFVTFGIASKCCISWYSDPVSIKYFTIHRTMKRALNVCQMCIVLKIEVQMDKCEQRPIDKNENLQIPIFVR